MIGSQYILVPERELAKVIWVRLSLDYKEPKTKKKKKKEFPSRRRNSFRDCNRHL